MNEQVTWPKIVIHGVSLVTFPDTAEGMDDLFDEIRDFNSHMEPKSTPRYIGKQENREFKAFSSVVVALNTFDQVENAIKKGVQC
ncbi:hypothetical protein V1514DRAFT_334803 [Lipomyces japonicus]|uniref:uncharacterized protein n=1 Tax=Lipomyces japonicus TaxID=56871 RepID=UPI0034CEF428